MKKEFARFGAIGAFCALSTTAIGAPIALNNQGFESGLVGWDTSGAVTVESSATVVTYAPFPTGTTTTVSPRQGSRMARLVSNNGVDEKSNVAALDAFFSLKPDTISNFLSTAYQQPGTAWNGSGVKQSFSGFAGDVLQQYWNFFSTEDVDYDYGDGSKPNDAAFYVITGPNNLEYIDFLSSGNPPLLVSSHTQSAGEKGTTGWRLFEYAVNADGAYTIGFGVVNWRDDYFDAELFLDDFSDVPEPASIALLGLGLACLGGLRRKRPGRL